MAQFHRDKALDRAKGLAIFAVVLFHITRGFVNAELLPRTAALSFADTWAYGWHVQTFFLIAGYLAFPRAGEARYQLRRQASLYYAYLLWSLISGLLLISLADKVNAPVDWMDLAWIPLMPIQHFWFLLALMFGTALLYLLRSAPMLLATAVTLLALGHPPVLASLGGSMPIVTILCHSAPFMLIGGWLANSGLRLAVNPWAALICFAAFALMAWQATLGGITLIASADIPYMLAGCYAIYAAGHYAGAIGWLARALDLLGRHSLVIYILHVIAGAGVRIILAKLVPDLNVGVAITLSLGAALILPIIAERIALKLGLAVLLGFAPLPFWSARRTEQGA